MTRRLERDYQSGLIKEIKRRLPGCVVLKNDPNYIAGIPDLIVLYEDRWALLEVKRSSNYRTEPNQDYYIEMFDEWSFAAFIYPENEEAVLDALEQSFKSSGSTRIP